MPWVRALLKGKLVYARADASGALAAPRGLVEVRYKPNDGRMYTARLDNLQIADATLLPDETCGPAEKPEKAEKPAEQERRAAGAKAGPHTPHVPPAAPEAGGFVAYADGACSGNPGPAGLGVVLLGEDLRVELSEYLGTGTNNVAELTAILRAVAEAEARGARSLTVHTDSQYSIGVLQKGWKAKANVELVAEVKQALARLGPRAVRLSYVPGHAGVLLNERADALARQAVSTRRSQREEFARAASGRIERAGSPLPGAPDPGAAEASSPAPAAPTETSVETGGGTRRASRSP